MYTKQSQRPRCSTLLSTNRLCAACAGTKTIPNAETTCTQTGHTDAVHSLALWIRYLQTVEVLDYGTATYNQRITTMYSTPRTLLTTQIPDDYLCLLSLFKNFLTHLTHSLTFDFPEYAVDNRHSTVISALLLRPITWYLTVAHNCHGNAKSRAAKMLKTKPNPAKQGKGKKAHG